MIKNREKRSQNIYEINKTPFVPCSIEVPYDYIAQEDEIRFWSLMTTSLFDKC